MPLCEANAHKASFLYWFPTRNKIIVAKHIWNSFAELSKVMPAMIVSVGVHKNYPLGEFIAKIDFAWHIYEKRMARHHDCPWGVGIEA